MEKFAKAVADAFIGLWSSVRGIFGQTIGGLIMLAALLFLLSTFTIPTIVIIGICVYVLKSQGV